MRSWFALRLYAHKEPGLRLRGKSVFSLFHRSEVSDPPVRIISIQQICATDLRWCETRRVGKENQYHRKLSLGNASRLIHASGVAYLEKRTLRGACSQRSAILQLAHGPL